MVEKVKPPTEYIELTPELQALRKKYLDEAIVNLLSGKTPKEAILNRKGRGGGSYDYVPIYWFVAQANALFGFLWDVVVDDKGILEEEVEVEDVPEGLSRVEYERLKVKGEIPTKKVKSPTQVWALGHVDINIPGKTTIVRDMDGEGKVLREVETRVDPIKITKHAFGGVDIKYYSDGSGIIDIGDDFKSAEADFTKKALSYLGMCADVYGKREIEEATGPNENQMRILMKKASYLDSTQEGAKEKLNRMCQAEFNVGLEEIDTGQYMKLVSLLAQGARKQAAGVK